MSAPYSAQTDRFVHERLPPREQWPVLRYDLPAGWTLMRSKRAGDVGYHLARRGAPAHNDENNRGSA